MGGCGCKKNNNQTTVQQPTNITLTETGTPVVTQPAPAPTDNQTEVNTIIDRLNNQ
jgi:hypothetical protein